VSCNRIGQVGAAALADALQHNSTLTTLNLAQNKITHVGAAALAVALHSNSTLTTLDLCTNDLDDEGVAALADRLRLNSALTTLKLSYNRFGCVRAQSLVDVLLRDNSTLTTLDLSSSQIRESIGSAVADASQHNSCCIACPFNYGRQREKDGCH
jgi:Ran GTPase-activating protein (RanGAP) involved in mRNA processing and transport